MHVLSAGKGLSPQGELRVQVATGNQVPFDG